MVRAHTNGTGRDACCERSPMWSSVGLSLCDVSVMLRSSLTPRVLLTDMRHLQFYKLFYKTLPDSMHSDLHAMCGDI